MQRARSVSEDRAIIHRSDETASLFSAKSAVAESQASITDDGLARHECVSNQ